MGFVTRFSSFSHYLLCSLRMKFLSPFSERLLQINLKKLLETVIIELKILIIEEKIPLKMFPKDS